MLAEARPSLVYLPALKKAFRSDADLCARGATARGTTVCSLLARQTARLELELAAELVQARAGHGLVREVVAFLKATHSNVSTDLGLPQDRREQGRAKGLAD